MTFEWCNEMWLCSVSSSTRRKIPARIGRKEFHSPLARFYSLQSKKHLIKQRHLVSRSLTDLSHETGLRVTTIFHENDPTLVQMSSPGLPPSTPSLSIRIWWKKRNRINLFPQMLASTENSIKQWCIWPLFQCCGQIHFGIWKENCFHVWYCGWDQTGYKCIVKFSLKLL